MPAYDVNQVSTQYASGLCRSDVSKEGQGRPDQGILFDVASAENHKLCVTKYVKAEVTDGRSVLVCVIVSTILIPLFRPGSLRTQYLT